MKEDNIIHQWFNDYREQTYIINQHIIFTSKSDNKIMSYSIDILSV